MIFNPTNLPGAFIIELERREDERGYFARAFCREEFKAHGLAQIFVQANFASNRRKGTLRGMHFQYPPAAEAKLVRCTRGALLDVIVDLRPESPTYLQHFAIELTAVNQKALYIPERFAHGYQALRDGTDMLYHTSEMYTPSTEGGLRHDDPRLAIRWPLSVSCVSQKDQQFPNIDAVELELHRRMSIKLETARVDAPSVLRSEEN